MSGKGEMFSEKSVERLFNSIENRYSGKFKRPKDDDAETRRIWAKALNGYTVEEVRNALNIHVVQDAWPPTIADFVRICKEERERKAESERLTKKNVCYIAERAINTSYPAIGLEEFHKAKRAFEKRCYEAENPAKAALRLERYMRTLADETSPIAVIEGAEI